MYINERLHSGRLALESHLVAQSDELGTEKLGNPWKVAEFPDFPTKRNLIILGQIIGVSKINESKKGRWNFGNKYEDSRGIILLDLGGEG
jgi:hypothetical protein